MKWNPSGPQRASRVRMISEQRAGLSCGPEMKKGLPSWPKVNSYEQPMLLPQLWQR